MATSHKGKQIDTHCNNNQVQYKVSSHGAHTRMYFSSTKSFQLQTHHSDTEAKKAIRPRRHSPIKEEK
uniref:Uncharacterized protein n=1 Tax=Arundo donax TaxID=35708 RepID=A0A0A8Z2Y5_ARUDO